MKQIKSGIKRGIACKSDSLYKIHFFFFIHDFVIFRNVRGISGLEGENQIS